MNILKTITTITLSLSILNPFNNTNNTESNYNITIPTPQNEIVQTIENYSNCYTQDLKTNEDLQEYATQFLEDNYNIELNIPVTFKSIDSNILGAFYYNKDTNKPIKIVINNLMLADNNYCSHDIERTLIHECTHLALNILNQDFKDGQESFENENYKLGGRSNDINTKANYLNSKIMVKCCN